MIDFHNHTIPNLDDGSKSIEMSIDMYKNAEAQGITDVINTVHYQHPKMDDKDTSSEYVLNEIKKMQEELDNAGINIKIHSASEVFYLPNLTDILENEITTFGNYMLIEFQTFTMPESFEKEFYNLQLKGITPIIAHPERYRKVQENVDIVDTWLDRGYLLQMDCGSILQHFGSKVYKVTKSILEKGSFHLIGSDAHNNTKRNFCLKEALNKIEKLTNSDYVNLFNSNLKKLLNNDKIDSSQFFVDKKEQTFIEKLFSKIRKN